MCWRDASHDEAFNIYVRSTDKGTIGQAKNVFSRGPFTPTCIQKEKNEFIARAARTRTRHVHFLIYIQFLPEGTYIQRTTSDQRTTHRFIVTIRIRELFCESTFVALCIINPILFLLFIYFLCVVAIRKDLAHRVQFIVHTYTAKMGLLLFLCVLSMAAVTCTPYAAIATSGGWYHSFMYTVTNVSLTSFCGL